jgi:hypothetical protein
LVVIGGFCCWGFFIVWFLAWCVSTIVKDTVNFTKKVLEDEDVQEVGKGFLAVWLDSFFDKK